MLYNGVLEMKKHLKSEVENDITVLFTNQIYCKVLFVLYCMVQMLLYQSSFFKIRKEMKEARNAWDKVGKLLWKSIILEIWPTCIDFGFGPLSYYDFVVVNWWDFREWLVLMVFWWFHKKKHHNVFLFCNVRWRV